MDALAVREPTYSRFPISVEMYHLMAERGVFAPEDRVELIEGELFEMSPIGSLHARCVNFLNRFLVTSAGSEYIVQVQNPIILNDLSEPQPDFSIVRHRQDFYKDGLPEAPDVAVVFEIAETSVTFDKNVKFRRYAAAGIPEAWLIDLTGERVEVHSQPKENGYGIIKIYQRGENAVSEMIPSIDLSVDDILG
ncbi:MAG: Uma2 family endonuclease [Pyrinomonadaceae bacterium]